MVATPACSSTTGSTCTRAPWCRTTSRSSALGEARPRYCESTRSSSCSGTGTSLSPVCCSKPRSGASRIATKTGSFSDERGADQRRRVGEHPGTATRDALADAAAEELHGDERGDRDQGDEERVLHKGGAGITVTP